MNDKKNIAYLITGMDCISCAGKIETFCKKISGVEGVQVNFAKSILHIVFNSKTQAKEKVEKGMESIGYRLQEQSEHIFLDISLEKKMTNNLIRVYQKKFNTSIPKREIVNLSSIQQNYEMSLPEKTKSTFFKELFSKSHRAIVLLVMSYLLCFFIENFLQILGHKEIAETFSYAAFSIITIVGFFPIFRRAIEFIKVGYYFSVEMLMSISAIGALFINAAPESAAVIILFLIGEWLESYTSNKASQEIKSIASLLPDSALLVREDASTCVIKTSEIQVGNLIEVKPGERLPVDGIITKGTSYIDESLLTGESLPVSKTLNSNVVAGSICIDGNIFIKATKSASHNSINRIINLVEEAQSSKSSTMRSIEKFSRVYTPIVLLIGLLTAIVPPLISGNLTSSALWINWIYKGLTILLIGCPCALVISTPSAIAAGITSAAKLGILIKNAASIELIGKIKTIAFDKTGTITKGKLEVTDIVSLARKTNEEILSIAASIEEKSTHPLAKSILAYAAQKKVLLLPISEAKTLAGKGVFGKVLNSDASVCSPTFAHERALLSEEQAIKINEIQNEGKTVSVVTFENEAIGLIALSDKLKDDALSSLSILNHMGVKSVILTGDNKISAMAITKSLNAEVYAELLPSDKLEKIQTLSRLAKIAMVGDGINDAPALAAADISIAMGGGTDVAVETSQIVIANNNLSAIADLVLISRKTMVNIHQNITIAILLKIFFFVLTLAGLTTLWMAIFADTGATVLVTLNAMRLLRYKKINFFSAPSLQFKVTS